MLNDERAKEYLERARGFWDGATGDNRPGLDRDFQTRQALGNLLCAVELLTQRPDLPDPKVVSGETSYVPGPECPICESETRMYQFGGAFAVQCTNHLCVFDYLRFHASNKQDALAIFRRIVLGKSGVQVVTNEQLRKLIADEQRSINNGRVVVAELNADLSDLRRQLEQAAENIRQDGVNYAAIVNVLNETSSQLEEMTTDRNIMTREVKREQQQAAEYRALLGELVDDEPCSYDHHGYCQTHGLSEKPCVMERARAALSGEKGGAA